MLISNPSVVFWSTFLFPKILFETLNIGNELSEISSEKTQKTKYRGESEWGRGLDSKLKSKSESDQTFSVKVLS